MKTNKFVLICWWCLDFFLEKRTKKKKGSGLNNERVLEKIRDSQVNEKYVPVQLLLIRIHHLNIKREGKNRLYSLGLNYTI